MTGYRIEPLGKQDRKSFTCGDEMLDRYLHERASQDARRRVAFCFVAVTEPGETIAGYYTLAATSVALDLLPPERGRQLPRYPVVPAVLLGRLAVATAHQGRHLGGALLVDALARAARSEIAAHLMVVDAKHAAAAAFYEYLGFVRLSDDGLRLVRAL